MRVRWEENAVRLTVFSNWVADDQPPPGFEMLVSLLAPAHVRFVGRSLSAEDTQYHFFHADVGGLGCGAAGGRRAACQAAAGGGTKGCKT